MTKEKPDSLRILYVEDSEHDIILFHQAFKKSNISFEISDVSRAEKALELLSTNAYSFDVIVSDYKLPGITGLELVRELIKKNIKLPSVLITGQGDENLAVDALKAGVTDYLVKDNQQAYLELLPLVISEAVKRYGDKIARIKAEKEKETLLYEIHHRVKNNMTVISSLLKLQADKVDNDEAKAALMDSQNRIQSMSAIHKTLYQSGNLSAVDMKTYLSSLAGAVAQSYSIGKKVNLLVESKNVLIGAKQASPVGLIVNELITNSLKYAFPENQEGEIKISLQEIEDQIELEYIDNGIGIPEDFDWKNSKSLGLKLVRTLVENQLDGSIDLDTTKGPKFTIKFSIET